MIWVVAGMAGPRPQTRQVSSASFTSVRNVIAVSYDSKTWDARDLRDESHERDLVWRVYRAQHLRHERALVEFLDRPL